MNSLLDEASVRALLDWFAEYGIDYPWSRTADPWAVWVSEVMLQQTTVSAAEPRYIRWMDRFPGPEDLAQADEREVLREWEGLGYYSRARNLAAAARVVRDSHGGSIPENFSGLKALPGVGDYTAAAIASFCFGERRAAVDANGRRIAQRLAAQVTWDSALDARFRNDVETLMPSLRPGDLNAAIMQLGQQVCTPSSPDCSRCPLGEICRARSENLQNEIPARRKAQSVRMITKLALLYSGGRVLMRRRSEGIGRGLWFFPPEDEIEGLEQWIPGEELPSRVHSYTRYRETLLPRVFRASGDACIRAADYSGTWIGADELEGIPMPTAYRRIAGDFASETCVSGCAWRPEI